MTPRSRTGHLVRPLRRGLRLLGSTILTSLMVLGIGPSVALSQQALYSHGDPSSLEQYMLELVNRARMNPAQEGVLLDTLNTVYSRDARARKPAFFTNLRGEFSSYPAVPPLAFHPRLLQAARAHSQDMINRGYFAHVNPEGRDPSARAAAAGYDSGAGENLSGAGAANADEVLHSHFGLMVDYDNIDTAHPLGHRLNILERTYTEVGVGIAGPYYSGRITQDFGAPSRSYILGVAYDDANGNGAYDPGEGLAGVTVRPNMGNWYAVTSSSGGFAIPIDPVETVTDNVNLPFPVQGTPWSAVLPYDLAYRQQQLQAAPSLIVNLTWSGGGLATAQTSTVTIKRPVLRNFRLTGTDNYYYSRSTVTTQNVKGDFIASAGSIIPPMASTPLRDFNNDRRGDLLFQNTAGQIAVWYMNASGSSAGSTYLYSGGLGDWKLASIAEMNGDGIADLIFQNNAGQLAVWYMNASGAIASSAYLYTGGLGDWRVRGTADINKDGNTDLLFQNNAGQIVVWYMNGRGATASAAYLSTSVLGDWKLSCAVDINGDGNTDFIFQNNIGQIVVWVLNAGGSVNSSAYLYAAGLGDWRVKGTADTNGDGTADLIFQNNVGQIAVWYMNGRSSSTGSAFIYSGGLGDWQVR